MATRIRNIWYKVRKWLQYHPNKYYMRGKSDKNRNGDNNNVDAKLAIGEISRVHISRHGDMRKIEY
jgi:hypothetical protein